ncbi:hypothetical protein NE237_024812 [Protea cynaroides]|uniref:Uncharacterized protein n=1 Tax=Protea cynaroides TaxID=273540 RepID=A0A9Q0H2Y5_9MAGN|nr:hypothetical protein NE237_024812 [Protea cynaroides]
MVTKLDNQEEPNLDQNEDSESEDSLSFCDLPIYSKATSTTTNWGADDDDDDDDNRRRPSTDQELFEFFCDLRADMCPADDIIFCGKLIPYKEKECQSDKDVNQNSKIKSFLRRRRRSESLDELQRSQSSAKDQLMQKNHSLDYQKLRRISSSTFKPFGKYFGKENNSSSSSSSSSSLARPKWPWLMFGIVKVQKETELKDIKKRQNRLNPAPLFPAVVTGSGDEKVGVRKEEEKGSWRLLRALSCRGHASAAAVTASFGCIPHV